MEETEDRQPKCEMPGCDGLVVVRGLCQEHYDSWRNGTTEHPRSGVFKKSGVSVKKGTCLIEGCDEPARTRGLCSPHYQSWRKGYIEHPAGDKFTISQIHHKSKGKTPETKKPNPGTKSPNLQKKESPVSRSYPFPDLVTLDFTEYPDLKTSVFKQADKYLLPVTHVIMSLLATVFVERKKD